MDPIRDFATDVGSVLAACAAQVASYPAILREPGLGYLEQHRLLRESSQGNGIVYLLPLWLGDGFGLARELAHQVALASTFGLLYFFTQDEVMDAGEGQNLAQLLPLANLFLLDSLAPYRRLFPAGSPFWPHLDASFQEWATSVAWEREEHWGRPRPFAEADLLRLAGKAAPLKVPCTAAALLACRPDAIAPLAETIERLQVVFQLIDDLRDWRDDLAAGNFTYFLVRVLGAAVVDPGRPTSSNAIRPSDVENAPGLENALGEVLSLAMQYSRLALESSAGLPVPYLKAYIASQDRQCRRLCEEFLNC